MWISEKFRVCCATPEDIVRYLKSINPENTRVVESYRSHPDYKNPTIVYEVGGIEETSLSSYNVEFIFFSKFN